MIHCFLPVRLAKILCWWGYRQREMPLLAGILIWYYFFRKQMSWMNKFNLTSTQSKRRDSTSSNAPTDAPVEGCRPCIERSLGFDTEYQSMHACARRSQDPALGPEPQAHISFSFTGAALAGRAGAFKPQVSQIPKHPRKPLPSTHHVSHIRIWGSFLSSIHQKASLSPCRRWRSEKYFLGRFWSCFQKQSLAK